MSSGAAVSSFLRQLPYKGFLFFLCGCLLTCLLPELAAASRDTDAASLAGRRFSATIPLSPDVSFDDATVVAAAAARAKAMRAAVRALVGLPEVRIAGSMRSSPHSPPNLLALAYATVRTETLLVSQSRKESSVTVTVAVTDDETAEPLGARVRDALIHPDRLGLFEKAVLREKALLEKFESLMPGEPSRETRNPEDFDNPAAIINEIRALEIFKAQLPSRNSVWMDPAGLRDAMRGALALAPNSALLRNALGDALLQLGRSQEAFEEQTAALKLDPSFARAFYSRGAASLALQYLSSAVADFSEAIARSPFTAAYYRARGMARHLQGEEDAMCRDLHQACGLGECEEYQWAVSGGFCQ